MKGTRHSEWVEHTLEALADAGYRTGGARTSVVECLGRQSCAVTAREIEDELRATDEAAGRASIYRALEQLEQLRLVHRLEIGTGTASYERAEPTGEHHHHLVCERCGEVVPFEDKPLERAITALSRRSRFEVSEHDVTLRGLCQRCAS